MSSQQFLGVNPTGFPLSPSNSNVFGLLTDISTPLSYDYTQGIIAYGTSLGVAKLWSLRFQELFIDNNEGDPPSPIEHLCLVSSLSLLVCVDANNRIKAWSLASSPPKKICSTQLPESLSLVYTPSFFSAQESNNGIVCLATVQGDILIFDCLQKKVLDYKIPFSVLYPGQAPDCVLDMATHYKKMQRILVAFPE